MAPVEGNYCLPKREKGKFRQPVTGSGVRELSNFDISELQIFVLECVVRIIVCFSESTFLLAKEHLQFIIKQLDVSN